MNRIWQNRGWKALALTPVSAMFFCVTTLRRKLYAAGHFSSNQFSVPVIVVGNISVGGTGKTPLVGALITRLQAAGFKPGIVSRGYGAQKSDAPRVVSVDTPVALAGDEPALLARDTGVPTVICTNRSAAVQALIDNANVNVIVSDDGLQHYAMSRDFEIAVVDGQRGLGNGFVLPAGPLRETASRLHGVSIVAVQQTANSTEQNKSDFLLNVMRRDALSDASNSGSPSLGSFFLRIKKLKCLHDDNMIELASLQGQQVHAMAGLGNPTRFFESLKRAGLTLIEHAMPDHHNYITSDFDLDSALPILVTSKDAVKIRELSIDKHMIYEVPVEAELDEQLSVALDKLVQELA